MNAVKPIILALNPISSEIGEIDNDNNSVTGSTDHIRAFIENFLILKSAING